MSKLLNSNELDRTRLPPSSTAPKESIITDTAAFLLKDLVLLAASFYLLRQDAVRVAKAVQPGKRAMEAGRAA